MSVANDENHTAIFHRSITMDVLKHLPDAVTIVTVLHFLPNTHAEMERGRKGGAGIRRGRGESVPLGAKTESFALNLVVHNVSVHPIKTATPFIVEHKRTKQFNSGPVSCQVC